MTVKKMILTPVLGLLAFSAAARADDATPNATPTSSDSLLEALEQGRPLVELRYRFEDDGQDGIHKDADASTLRTRIGYETGYFEHVKALFEVENVSVLGPTDYNNTFNNETSYPRVNDPTKTDINQFYFSTDAIAQTDVTVGRQRFSLDNARFVGSSQWRQNEPYFDAARVTNTSLPDTTLDYVYSDNVFRNLGSTFPIENYSANINLFHAHYSGVPYIGFSGYGYLVDMLHEDTFSSKTFGGRGEGAYPVNGSFKATYVLEMANQTPYSNNSEDFNLNYYRIEPGLEWNHFAASVGEEILQGNGKYALQMPLGSNHAFNGWANMFTTTPANGLDDHFVTAGYTFANQNAYLDGTRFRVQYHAFYADRGDSHYGNEIDTDISRKIFKHYTLTLEFDDYKADNFDTDTRKAAFMIAYDF